MKRFMLCALSALMAGAMLASCSRDQGIEPTTSTPVQEATPAPQESPVLAPAPTA